MKHFAKRITALLLLLLMTASLLVSCGGGKESNPIGEANASNEEGTSNQAEVETEYQKEILSGFTGDNEVVMDMVQSDGNLCALVGMPGYSSFLASSDEEKERTETPVKRTVSAVYCNGELFFLAYDDRVGYAVFREDTLLWETGLTELRPDISMFLDVVSDGNTLYGYVNMQNQKLLFAGEQKVAFEEETADGIFQQCTGLVKLAGKVYAAFAVTRKDGNEATDMDVTGHWRKGFLVPLDPGLKTIDSVADAGLELPDLPGICTTDGENAYWVRDKVLYRYDGETEVPLHNLTENGVDSYSILPRILSLGEGWVAVCNAEGIIKLPPPGGMKEPAQNITIGTCGGVDYMLEQACLRFNRTQEEIVARLTNYKSREDMNLAILSGEVDAIASNDPMVLRNFARQEVLLNLEDALPELFEEGVLLPSVTEAIKYRGGTYFLPRSVEFYFPSCRAEVAGGKIRWESYTEFGNLLKSKHPGCLKSHEKKLILQHFLFRTLDHWIDWDEGTASFASREFEEMLSFCNLFARDESEALANTGGRAIFDISQFAEFLGLEYAMDDNDTGGKQRVILSLPGYETASMHSSFYIGIVNGERKAESQSFMRYFFLESDWEKELAESGPLGFSVIVDECRKQIGFGTQYTDIAETHEALDMMDWELICGSDHLGYVSNEVTDAIIEEAYRYFAGDITAKQAADYVQNRISLYLAEQS